MMIYDVLVCVTSVVCVSVLNRNVDTFSSQSSRKFIDLRKDCSEERVSLMWVRLSSCLTVQYMVVPSSRRH